MAEKTVNLTIGDNDLECKGDYTTAVSGSAYTKNGDPGSPPEPADFVLDTVHIVHVVEGKAVKIDISELLLNLGKFDEVGDMCLERLEEEDGAEFDDYDDEEEDYEDEEEEDDDDGEWPEDMGDDSDLDD